MKEADIPALQACPDISAFALEDGYFRQCYDLQENGDRQIFVAFDADERPAGYVILNFKPRYALYRKLAMPEIQDLNVRPAYRRQGIGKALLDLCEEMVKTMEYGAVGVSVGLHDGFGPAQQLYVRRGYVPDGNGVTYDREPVTRHEMRPVDDDLCLMMVKELGRVYYDLFVLLLVRFLPVFYMVLR